VSTYQEPSLEQPESDFESTEVIQPEADGLDIPGGTGFYSVLRNPSFLALWSAQITSQMAQNSVWYVLLILISRLTGGSVLAVGGIIIMVQLPTVLFSAVSGVLVDRVSKKMILISTNFIRAGAVVGYLFFMGSGEMLYVITFFVAVVSQPFQPAEGATIPLIVRKEQLITANSLFQATAMASQLSGFVLAPTLLFVGKLVFGYDGGIRFTLFVLIGLFCYAGGILFLLPAVTNQRKVVETDGLVDSAAKVWLELLEGVRFILADRKLLMALIQISFAPALLLILAEIAPQFVRTVLNITDPNTMFFVLAPAGLGLGLGLFILGHYGSRIRKDRLVVVAMLALSMTILGLADVPSLAHEFWLPFTLIGINPPESMKLILTMIPISLLAGVCISFINAPIQTILQERSSGKVLGRVLAMQQTLQSAVSIPPLLAIGAITAAVGVQGALGLMGVIMFFVGLASVYEI
jgi:MFS family permease